MPSCTGGARRRLLPVFDRRGFDLCVFALCGFALVAAPLACARSPLGHRQLTLIPEDQIAGMGAQAFEDIKQQTPIARDPATNRYVECVVESLLEHADEVEREHLPERWEVVVFESPQVNAFALPGGKIGVYTGLIELADSPAELATVLAHEISHVIAQHGNAQASEVLLAEGGLSLLGTILQGRGLKYDLLLAAMGLGTQVGILLPHGRRQEAEADILGYEIMARAGYEPRAAIELWQAMERAGGGQPPEFLSTHPSYGTRIDYLRAVLPKVQRIAARAEPARCATPPAAG